MTHTEKVHVIFGLMATAAGLFALWAALRTDSRARLVWPIITFVIGFLLFIPVEAQTRTYQEVGWWATLLSAVPESPEYWLRNWLRLMTHWHVVQHKIGGLLIMAAGVVEYARGRGRLAGPGWGAVLPVLLLGIGLAFGVHGGSNLHLPHRTEQFHHEAFGVAFAAAALALAVTRAGWARSPAWRAAWAALVVLVGLQTSIFYRLTPAERNAQGHHHHEGAGPGVR